MPDVPPRRPRWPLPTAAVAGLLTTFSLPPWGWWPLAPVGLSALYALLGLCRGRAARFCLAFAFWTAGFVVGVVWVLDVTVPGYVITVPALAAIMATPLAIAPATGPARVASFPAALVVGEAWRSAWPFGGVPMSGLALGQVGAPWVDVARVGTHFAVVAVVALIAVAGVEAVRRDRRPAIVAGTAVVLAAATGMLAPDGVPNGTIAAAVVQGGGPLGTRAVDTPDEVVWDRHVEATARLDGSVELVVWPETVEDVDIPLEAADRTAELGDLAVEHDATFVVGLNERAPGTRRNVVAAVGPDGTVADRYDKVHLVPFGEYVPLRDLVENFADLSVIGTEITPGHGPAILRLGDPPISLSPPISFEIYFTDRVREGVLQGAALVVNPTLASSYRSTLVPEQTLAAGRLRAIEAGRWVLQSSTTGYSSIIDHRGRVVARTGLREQAVLESEVGLRTGLTWATRFGALPVIVASLAVLVSAAVAPLLRRPASPGAVGADDPRLWSSADR